MLNLILYIDTFTMVCLTSKDTGLNQNVWLDSLGCERKHNNLPYILIKRKIGWKRIYLHKASEHQNELRKWISINKMMIIKHWNHELSDRDILNIFKNNSE